MAQTETIKTIQRNFNNFPNTVGITTTADLETITSPGYWTDEQLNVEEINNGIWQWEPEDMVLIYYAINAVNLFQFDANNNTFVQITSVALDSIGFDQLSSAVGKQVKVTITSDQIKGMYASPILLVEAQGTNTLIDIQEIIWVIFYQTTQYTGGGAIKAQYGNGSSGSGDAASGIISAGSFQGINFSALVANAASSSNLFAHQVGAVGAGVYLSNNTGPFTAGDFGATLYITYRVIQIDTP